MLDPVHTMVTVMRRKLTRYALAFLVLASSALAQTNPQRVPPSDPELRFVGRMQDGKAAFVEAKTFGRWQGNGYGWLVLIDPEVLEPIWVREIVNCQNNVITDDYIVWMDTHLKAWASGDRWMDGGGNTHAVSAQERVGKVFASAACTGKPAVDTFQRLGSLQSAVEFARKLSN